MRLWRVPISDYIIAYGVIAASEGGVVSVENGATHRGAGHPFGVVRVGLGQGHYFAQTPGISGNFV